MAGGIPHGFILESIVFTGFRWGGVLLFAASGGIVFAVDIIYLFFKKLKAFLYGEGRLL